MAMKFTSASITPSTVNAGQGYILSVGIEYYGILYENSGKEMYDSNNKLISPELDYKSAYTGAEIDSFVEVFK